MRGFVYLGSAALFAAGLFGLSLAHASPPTLRVCDAPAHVAGAVKVPAHKLVRLKAEGVDAKAAILWRVYPSAGVDRATTPRGVLEFAAPPGAYRVECLVISQSAEGGLSVDERVTDVEIERGCEQVPPKVEPPKVDPPAKPKADAWNALGRIQFGNAGCTATVVYPRRPDGKWDVLTANHCIEHVGIGAKGSMQLRGRPDRLAVRVVARDATSDCAWLVTESADLGDLPFAYLAEKPADAGVKIWHGGYGVDVPGNREDGSVTRAADGNGQTEMSLSVSSGDSGGGIFRADTDEIISTVCCTTNRGSKARVWGANADSIRKLRPKATDTTGDWWTPAEVPIRGEPTGTEFKPMPMPVRPDVDDVTSRVRPILWTK